MVELEVLFSARSPADYVRRQRQLHDGFEQLAMPDEVWQRALEVQAALATRSEHCGAALPDLLIAASDQLTLALDGRLEHVYGYSFILTNLDVNTAEQLAELEWWYRHRTDIEALNKDAKLGAALRHLPSADHRVNTVWMWAALLACAISSWLQEITGIDYGNGRGRRTLTRLRRELICVPARLTRSGGITYLRLPPGEQLLATVLPQLQQLPRPG